ncbi:MAG: signal peptidase I [Clostridia bacterium]|nr:signal peptidase I [Clostridia bacterium]
MLEKDLQNSDLYEARFQCKERKSNARFFCALLAIFIVFVSFRGWWTSSYGGVIVDGLSMRTTLSDGQRLLMRYADKRHKAERGDIIVIYVGGYAECQSVKGDYLIKRLIAKEGDKVKCTDGQIEIKYAGTSEYTLLFEPYAYYGDYKKEYDFDEYTVGAGEIFFLGDNRSGKGTSVDSRYYQYPSGSHLTDRLYKESDVYGVVPDWAVENSEILSKIFF